MSLSEMLWAYVHFQSAALAKTIFLPWVSFCLCLARNSASCSDMPKGRHAERKKVLHKILRAKRHVAHACLANSSIHGGMIVPMCAYMRGHDCIVCVHICAGTITLLCVHMHASMITPRCAYMKA